MRIRELFEAESELAKLINAHCKNNLKALIDNPSIALFRGYNNVIDSLIERDDNVLAYKPRVREHHRISATGNSVVMRFVSQHPNWADVPARSLSAFASPSYGIADGFGDVWMVLPFDNVKSFATISNDFNYMNVELGTGSYTLFEIGDFFKNLEYYAKSLIESGELDYRDEEIMLVKKIRMNLRMTSLESIKAACSMTYELVKLLRLHNKKGRAREVQHFIDHVIDFAGSRNPYDVLEAAVTPKNIGVTVNNTYSDLKIHSVGEVWFEGEYLLLRPANDSNYADFVKSFIKYDLSKFVDGGQADNIPPKIKTAKTPRSK